MPLEPDASLDPRADAPDSAQTEVAQNQPSPIVQGAGGPTEPVSTPDRELIRTPTEKAAPPAKTGVAYDQMATIQERPPQPQPPSLVMRPAWIRAAVLATLPVLALGILLSSLSRPDLTELQWVLAASESPPGETVLRPPLDEDSHAPPLAIVREGNTLVARKTGSSGGELWRFSPATGAALPGQTLDDTVLWIPGKGPFAPPGAQARDFACLVLTKTGAGAAERLTVSLLERQKGAALWTLALDPATSRQDLFWVATDSGPALAFAPTGPGAHSRPVLLDISTGKRIPLL